MGLRHFRIHANGVAYALGAGGAWRVVVVDVLRERTLYENWADSLPAGPSSPDGVTDLEWGRSGELAWIVHDTELGGGPVVEVHTLIGGRRRLVASAPDVEPGSLALTSRYVYWTQGAAARSAALRPGGDSSRADDPGPDDPQGD